MSENQNRIVTDRWSNAATRALYEAQWPAEPACRAKYQNGQQCGGCSFYAPFDADWGLCNHQQSRHYLETVFEHCTCPVHVAEGWGPHSFSDDPRDHCRCGGESDD